jgi:3-dehydrosphinganine reductase
MIVKDFRGAVAYVTGGSSGIGLAVARLMASRGADVAIFAREYQTLKGALEVLEGCRVAATQRLLSFQMDVSRRDMVEDVLAEAVDSSGPPVILVNSAGISHPLKFEDIRFETFDQIVKTNLYGTWNTIDVLLSHLKKKKGHIVNVASIAGFIGVFGMTAYSASKFAVIGLSEALRSELRPSGVTVSVLCPPDVTTPMLRKANLIKPEEAKAISAASDVMEPDVVARAMLRSMRKGEFLIIPNSAGRFTHVIKRLLPGFAERVIDQKIAEVQRKNKSKLPLL